MNFKLITINLFLILNTFWVEGDEICNETYFSYHKVILVEWNDSVTDQEVLEVKRLFAQLEKEVDGLKNMEFRKLYGGTYDYQISLEFSNKRAMEMYKTHPKHDNIRKVASTSVKSVVEYYFRE
ncbi:MAG: Dabb family protein [Flagellimonas sp.]